MEMFGSMLAEKLGDPDVTFKEVSNPDIHPSLPLHVEYHQRIKSQIIYSKYSLYFIPS